MDARAFGYSKSNEVPCADTISPAELAKMQGTAHGIGAIGSNPVTLRRVREIATKQDEILDFGAGKDPRKGPEYWYRQARALQAEGYNVTPYDFGDDTAPLERQYDLVYASNVLNIEPNRDAMNCVLDLIAACVRPGSGRFVANYSDNPRYSDISPEELREMLLERFERVVRVDGDSARPVFECGGVRVPVDVRALKKVGRSLYVHRSQEGQLPADVLGRAKDHLPPNWSYAVVKYDAGTGNVSFIQSPDFDTAPEPTVGDSFIVHLDGSTTIRSYDPSNPQIYHHKWSFVGPDYTGFDVEESKRRSAAWTSLPNVDRNRIGYQRYWEREAVPLIPDTRPLAFSEPYQATADHPLSHEEMLRALRLDLASEHDAISLYNSHRQAISDPLVRDVLQEIITDEKDHARLFSGLIEGMDPTGPKVSDVDVRVAALAFPPALAGEQWDLGRILEPAALVGSGWMNTAGVIHDATPYHLASAREILKSHGELAEWSNRETEAKLQRLTGAIRLFAHGIDLGVTFAYWPNYLQIQALRKLLERYGDTSVAFDMVDPSTGRTESGAEFYGGIGKQRLLSQLDRWESGEEVPDVRAEACAVPVHTPDPTPPFCRELDEGFASLDGGFVALAEQFRTLDAQVRALAIDPFTPPPLPTLPRAPVAEAPVDLTGIDARPGVLTDPGVARSTPCIRLELGQGRRPLVFSKGVVGALNQEQQALYCQEGYEVRQATEGELGRVAAMEEAARGCSEATAGMQGADRLSAYFECMSERL